MPGWELIDNKEKRAINNLFKFQGWNKKPIFITILKVKEFEYKFAKYVNLTCNMCILWNSSN